MMRDKQATCRSTAKAGKDCSCQGNTHALSNNTAGSQETRCTSLSSARSITHKRAVIWRLEHGLTNASDHQAPDDIPHGALRIELADKYKGKAGYCKSPGGQPAGTNTICKS